MSTAFLFPGQGSQFVGMGRALYEREPVARALYDEADALLGFALSRLCFEGPEEALTDTAVQQPALFTTSLAAWAVLSARGAADAAYVAGHSLGEFSALAAAGALTFAGGLALVRRRGELMKLAG
ncbi:MAG TPA: ACP S-malonyltransferase, partial [Promineifilum sp.]|nr:ACP S-malonyltransferase [Promineifilum sp.]